MKVCLRNLVEQSVQHANTEHFPSSKGQAEHKDQVGPLFSFFLQIKHKETHSLRHIALTVLEDQKSSEFILRILSLTALKQPADDGIVST